MEEAYKLMYRQEYPSWLYMVNNGATTIWERWDCIDADGRPGDNSYNHYPYGSVGDWLYKIVVGINPDPEFPGYKKTIIKPRPWGEMNNVSSSHESPYGTVSSEWQIEDDLMKLTVQIPVNTSAEIYIPATGSFLKVNGIQQKEIQIIDQAGFPYQFIHLTKGSGRYVFETKSNLYILINK